MSNQSEATRAARPNIVIILVDDMGYSDLGCYGGEAETPNLDRLAANGVKFTDFYCTPRCCPSRASLLTGLTPHKAGVGWMSFDWQDARDDEADGYTGTLNRDCVTIAEALKGAGYRSYISGKWHVTSHLDDKATWPTGRGFDRSFCMVAGGTSYFEPQHLTLDDKFYRPPSPTYLTDLIGTYSAAFVDEHHAEHADSPFFMYVAYTAPHAPLHAPEQVTAKYRERYAAGWDRLRAERYARMQEIEATRPQWELPPRPAHIPAWDTLPPEEREVQADRMATYAAMIEIMDRNVGTLVDSLERNGALDNTLIMFLSDNGACAEGPLMGSRTHYGECWAHLSNTPFRLYKHFTCQGGVQTPLIAHWPAGLGFPQGTAVHDVTGCLYDFMPTCLELAGAEYPRAHQGQTLHPLDGVSLVPALRGEGQAERADIFMEHEGNQLLRAGRYKLVRQHDEPFCQLYDMEADRSEMHDLADDMPERFTDLAQRYERWARQARVLPWERAGRYMEWYGYRASARAYHGAFADAMAAAPPDDVVDGASDPVLAGRRSPGL